MTSVVLIDTNLYKRLSKDRDGIYDHFEKSVLYTIGGNFHVASTLFGFCEYIGLKIPNIDIGPPPTDFLPDPSVKETYKAAFDKLDPKLANLAAYIRSSAYKEYTRIINEDSLKKKTDEEMKYQSQKFISGGFYNSLFLHNRNRPSSVASDLRDMLTIDYMHRYQHVPQRLRASMQWLNRSTAISEYFGEKRNVVLIRSAKSHWLERVKIAEEGNVPVDVLENIDRAMRSIKNDSDRFDLELLYFFLMGYFIQDKYMPANIFTQDSKDEVMGRLVVVWTILVDIFHDISAMVDDIGDDFGVQLASNYFFVNNEGYIVDSISSREFAKYLFVNNLTKQVS